MAFPTPIQRLPNSCRNASPGKRNAAHEEASELLVHQRKKEDPARDHSTGGEGPTEVRQGQKLFQFVQFNIRFRPYFFDFLLLFLIVLLLLLLHLLLLLFHLLLLLHLSHLKKKTSFIRSSLASPPKLPTLTNLRGRKTLDEVALRNPATVDNDNDIVFLSKINKSHVHLLQCH